MADPVIQVGKGAQGGQGATIVPTVQVATPAVQAPVISAAPQVATPAVQTPAISSVPQVATPAVQAPVISATPQVATPAVQTPVISSAPQVATPAVQTPVISSAPQVATPAVQAPVISSAPQVATPAVQTPVISSAPQSATPVVQAPAISAVPQVATPAVQDDTPVVQDDSPDDTSDIKEPAPKKTESNEKKPSGVVVDKSKSNEDYIAEAESEYIIPDIVRDKFPDLIKLIFETDSMKEEEREYWLQILPIMGEEQIVKFRKILTDEKEQLEKLDQKYKEEAEKYGASKSISEEDMKKRIDDMKKAEADSEVNEEQAEADLLKALEGM